MTKKEIASTLIMEDSYNQFYTFLSIMPKLKKENYWYALRFAYESSDNLFNSRYLVRAAFAKNEPCRYALMDKAESASLKALPNEVEIFRGIYAIELI